MSRIFNLNSSASYFSSCQVTTSWLVFFFFEFLSYLIRFADLSFFLGISYRLCVWMVRFSKQRSSCISASLSFEWLHRNFRGMFTPRTHLLFPCPWVSIACSFCSLSLLASVFYFMQLYSWLIFKYMRRVVTYLNCGLNMWKYGPGVNSFWSVECANTQNPSR